jgi:hypothetical protein
LRTQFVAAYECSASLTKARHEPAISRRKKFIFAQGLGVASIEVQPAATRWADDFFPKIDRQFDQMPAARAIEPRSAALQRRLGPSAKRALALVRRQEPFQPLPYRRIISTSLVEKRRLFFNAKVL